MALMGPRAEIQDMLHYYKSPTRARFQVRHGVIGLAQISGRGNLSFLETAELDVRYVRQRSRRTDIKILFKSMKCVMQAIGAF